MKSGVPSLEENWIGNVLCWKELLVVLFFVDFYWVDECYEVWRLHQRIFLHFSSTVRDSDESDDIPSDVDLSDPFFSQELGTDIKSKKTPDKVFNEKGKKKRKRKAEETEEEKKSKVSNKNGFKGK